MGRCSIVEPDKNMLGLIWGQIFIIDKEAYKRVWSISLNKVRTKVKGKI
jgi:hypothetical protein